MVLCGRTLELKRLSSGELAQLAGRQSELVSLELQSDGSLRLRDAILTASDVGQLGDLHHIPAFHFEKEERLDYTVKHPPFRKDKSKQTKTLRVS